MQMLSTNLATNLQFAQAAFMRDAAAYNANLAALGNGFVRGQVLARSLKAQRAMLSEARDYLFNVSMAKAQNDSTSARYYLVLARVALKAFKAERACYNMARTINSKR